MRWQVATSQGLIRIETCVKHVNFMHLLEGREAIGGGIKSARVAGSRSATRPTLSSSSSSIIFPPLSLSLSLTSSFSIPATPARPLSSARRKFFGCLKGEEELS
uniref:Uncharacterized protein n=1 Tax=Oryza nivara TaxID=4536 RepID=A0A0E0GKF4_ORYNI